MAKLSRIESRLAELRAQESVLLAERAKVYDEMAEGETVSLSSGRRLPRRRELPLPVVSDTDKARAEQYLRQNAQRRRVGA